MFTAVGRVQPYEQLEANRARRVSDRLTPAMVDDYSRELGLRPLDLGFFAPDGVLVTSRDDRPDFAFRPPTNRLAADTLHRAADLAIAAVCRFDGDSPAEAGAAEASRARHATRRVEIADLRDPLCVAAAHLILSLQRAHQKLRGTKGQTVLIADETSHRVDLTNFVREPFAWSDAYYGRAPRRLRLDPIVDVPYFADSRHVLLIQTADLIAYILRRYVELVGGGGPDMVRGEQADVETWAKAIASRSPLASVWPRRGGNSLDQLFRALAPVPLADLRPLVGFFEPTAPLARR